MNCSRNSDILQSFISTCYNYLTLNLKFPPGTNAGYVLRKQKCKFMTAGDFCFSDVKVTKENQKTLSTEGMFLDHLPVCSKQWPLHISKVSQVGSLGGNIAIYLDRPLTFKEILKETFERGHNYGQYPSNEQIVVLTADYGGSDEKHLDLSNYRVLLQKKLTYNLLSVLGYQVLSSKETDLDKPTELHLYSETTHMAGLSPTCVGIPCRAVVNSKHGSKECKISASDYFKMRLKDMEIISEHKYGNEVKLGPGWEDLLTKLSDAAVKMDLIGTSVSRTVILNLEADCTSNRTPRNKGAAFVLYNCARISEIMKQFEAKVAAGVYPPLVSIDDADFSLLSTEEEWELLFNYILVYPTMIRESCGKLSQGIVRTENICNFLMSMCNSFSSYYRRVRVLTEPRTHMLPQMFARLYLLRGIEQVLHNALGILDITPVSQM